MALARMRRSPFTRDAPGRTRAIVTSCQPAIRLPRKAPRASNVPTLPCPCRRPSADSKDGRAATAIKRGPRSG